MAEQKTIFLSYCHKDIDSANIIDKDLNFVGLIIRRDVRDVGYKDSFKEFMRRIRKCDHAVMLLSEDFLRSANCMYEMAELMKEEDFREKVLPVMIKPLSIFKPRGRAKLIKYWQAEEERINSSVDGIKAVNLGPLSEDLKKAQEICADIGKFISEVSDMKLLTLEQHKKDGYRELLAAIGYDKDAMISKILKIWSIEDEEERDKDLEFIIRNQPKNAIALMLKGISEFKKDRYKIALYYFEEVAQIIPKFSPMWNYIGFSLIMLNRLEDAIIALDRVLEINPRFANAWYNKGLALLNLKKFQDALNSFEQFLELNPDMAEGWAGKGVILGNFKRYTESLAAINKALILNPKLAEAWLYKGVILRELNRHEEALIAFDIASNIKPDFAEGWLGKAGALEKLGKLKEAQKAFAKAKAMKPELFEDK